MADTPPAPPAIAHNRRKQDSSKTTAQISGRRLMLLTGMFIVALAAIFAGKVHDEGEARRVETKLRVDRAATACAAAMNTAAVTGDGVRDVLAGCHPGGVSVAAYLSNGGDILSVLGAADRIDLSTTVLGALPLERSGAGELDLATGEATAAWIALDRGGAVMIAAPARDLYLRTPVYVTYAFLLAAIGLVATSLMSAFVRQSLPQLGQHFMDG